MVTEQPTTTRRAWLAIWRDIVEALGLLFVACGVLFIDWRAGLIVLGLGLILAATFARRK